MPAKRASVKSSQSSRELSEIKQVEKYEYLLVEYLKEISHEVTYLTMSVVALFLFIFVDSPFFSTAASFTHIELLRTIFVLVMIGSFAMFGIASIKKRNIEKKFAWIFN